MNTHLLPRYPIYIPSKGRASLTQCLTPRFLRRDDVPFYLVIEKQEYAAYAKLFGEQCLLTLPFSNRGLIAARNWIKDHATAAGHERHWQLDDNIRCIYRRWRARRIPCNAGPALAAVEDFVDRYENIALAGLNYKMFLPDRERHPPFVLNAHVYSCTLVLNSLPNRWRLRYNDDTDLCLQVLADGWCTILVNAFVIEKIRTMVISGGNTTDLYQGDGRLRMARSLERVWPRVVSVRRRFQRPQHYVYDSWKRFDTPLRRKPNVKIPDTPDEYGLRLLQVTPEIRGEEILSIVKDYEARHGEVPVISDEPPKGKQADGES